MNALVVALLAAAYEQASDEVVVRDAKREDLVGEAARLVLRDRLRERNRS